MHSPSFGHPGLLTSHFLPPLTRLAAFLRRFAANQAALFFNRPIG